jgi:subtilisin family serine protease
MDHLKSKLKPIFGSVLLTVFLLTLSFIPVQASGQSSLVRVNIKLTNPAILKTIEDKYNLSNVQTVFEKPSLGYVYAANIDSSQLLALKNESNVIYANLDRSISAADLFITQVTTVNDPFFTLDAKNTDQQWYLEKVKIPEAWSTSTGSTNVTVAILDTGIHASHLDLNDGRVVAGFDEIAKQDIQSAANSDDNGHGTLIAGVIGGISNNRIGIAGINWNVHLMPVKVLNAKGEGDIAQISSGIIWAADHGANIINMSLGGIFDADPTLAAAVTYAYNKGVLLLSAAGNDSKDYLGKNLDTTPAYPVCADNGQNMILGVAATDVNDVKANFSDFGINCIDVAAPGVRILSTAFIPSEPSDNLLIYADGTSLAVPIVSAVAALIKAAHPGFTNVQIRDLILNTAENINSLNQTNCLSGSCNGFLGHGRINALLAIQPQALSNGSLVREQSTDKVYLISGSVKQHVSQLALNQKYPGVPIINETENQLTNYTFGEPILPTTGTLVKGQTDSTVYYIDNQVRRPLTYLVFISRKFSFANVQVMSEPDLSEMRLADWYWPPDGTLVLIKGNPTVYVMDKQIVRPVTIMSSPSVNYFLPK